MISGSGDRRRKAMVWSTIASAAFHVLVLSLLFYALAKILMNGEGAGERVSEKTSISIEPRQKPKPAPRHHQLRKPVTIPPPPPQRALHELAKESPEAPPQPPRKAITSPLVRDQANFAREVAQLNRQNDPHAIPTIDPASAEAPSKSYSFNPSSNEGDRHGNGIISPIRGWHERGLDCYYARYTYTYPSGAYEAGNIVWPVCFDPESDPFHEPPHPMPFPQPQAGYSLPPGTELPPLEKQVYDEWLASNGAR